MKNQNRIYWQNSRSILVKWKWTNVFIFYFIFIFTQVPQSWLSLSIFHSPFFCNILKISFKQFIFVFCYKHFVGIVKKPNICCFWAKIGKKNKREIITKIILLTNHKPFSEWMNYINYIKFYGFHNNHILLKMLF